VQQLVALRGPQPLEALEIKQIIVGTNSYAKRINGEVVPVDTMGAQYSIPYCAALALTADPADPAQYEQAALDDSARRELARRVELSVDKEMEAVYPKHSGARVELRLANGERRGSVVLDPHGMPADPCTETERLEKFSRLASSLVKSPATIANIAKTIQGAAQLTSVRAITDLLRD
jgi:2-methylcitrate dehydratase PrpD